MAHPSDRCLGCGSTTHCKPDCSIFLFHKEKNDVTGQAYIDNYRDSGGQNWDLNDPKTYESTESWFPKDCLSLDWMGLYKRITHEIGHSLYYMICLHPAPKMWGDQYARVVEFGKHFVRESREPDRRENIAWLRKQLFLILDETENQC